MFDLLLCCISGLLKIQQKSRKQRFDAIARWYMYACFVVVDGKVSIYGAWDLVLKCHIQILPSSYLPSTARLNVRPSPSAIAAHPQKPTQFAVGLGLTDGAIIVFEPHKTW
ncbi:hypothetical protein V6N13_045838 [Hibiscus sabdariffa]